MLACLWAEDLRKSWRLLGWWEEFPMTTTDTATQHERWRARETHCQAWSRLPDFVLVLHTCIACLSEATRQTSWEDTIPAPAHFLGIYHTWYPQSAGSSPQCTHGNTIQMGFGYESLATSWYVCFFWLRKVNLSTKEQPTALSISQGQKQTWSNQLDVFWSSLMLITHRQRWKKQALL